MYLSDNYMPLYLLNSYQNVPGSHKQNRLAVEILHILIAERLAMIVLQNLKAVGRLYLPVVERLEADSLPQPHQRQQGQERYQQTLIVHGLILNKSMHTCFIIENELYTIERIKYRSHDSTGQ